MACIAILGADAINSPPAVMPSFSAQALETAFNAFAPLKRGLTPSPFSQPYPAQRVLDAFEQLSAPLAVARLQGGLLNPWAIAGLKRDEVRIAQALGGLWALEFGGAASRQFLARCLRLCLGGIDWEAELSDGYRVGSEISPLGLRSERIDLTIETAAHVIGIEMKIDAGLGPRQIERYVTAIDTRAAWRHASGHVVLLSPTASQSSKVPHLAWEDVAEAARLSVADEARGGFAEQLIASFGDYVRQF